MLTWKKGAVVLVTIELILVSLLALSVVVMKANGQYSKHASILIDGDSGFVKGNGVRGGQGTAQDPYIISEWDIPANEGQGILVRNTRAHFVIRDSLVHDGQSPGNWNFGGYTMLYPTGAGILLDNVTNCVVHKVALSDNAIGIAMNSCDNVSVDQCTIREVLGANLEAGIRISYSTNISLTGNQFPANGVTIVGSDKEHFRSHTITANNTIDGKPIQYYRDQTGLTIDGGSIGELIVANCSDVVIQQLGVSASEIGIHLAYVTRGAIEDCTVSNNSYCGILLDSCTDTVVGWSRILNSSSDGVDVNDCSNITIQGNDLLDNHGFGISAIRSRNITIVENQDRDGLFVRDSDNCSILRNNFFEYVFSIVNTSWSVIENNTLSNAFGGIWLSYGSRNVTVSGNVVSNCDVGIGLGENVSDARVFRNTLINNNVQTQITTTLMNEWSDGYPNGGNYWSNYTGLDIHSGPNQDLDGPDGIGDTPFTIAENLTDPYPLMTPGGVLADEPLAIFSVSSVVGPGGFITVDAAKSWDLNDSNDELEVRWDWQSDGVWDSEWSTEKSATAVPNPNPGKHYVTLQIRNTRGFVAASSRDYTVDATPPLVVLMSVNEPKDLYGDDERPSISIRYGFFDGESGMMSIEYNNLLIDDTPLGEAGVSYSGFGFGGMYSSGGYYDLYGVSAGFHSLKVRGYDKVGNMAEQEIRVFVGGPSAKVDSKSLILVLIPVLGVGGTIAVAALYRDERRQLKRLESTLPRPDTPKPPPN